MTDREIEDNKEEYKGQHFDQPMVLMMLALSRGMRDGTWT
jgi:hypothetical protein